MEKFQYVGLPSHVVFGRGTAKGPRLSGRIAGWFTGVRPHVPIEVAQAARAALRRGLPSVAGAGR